MRPISSTASRGRTCAACRCIDGVGRLKSDTRTGFKTTHWIPESTQRRRDAEPRREYGRRLDFAGRYAASAAKQGSCKHQDQRNFKVLCLDDPCFVVRLRRKIDASDHTVVSVKLCVPVSLC